jgi:hypothetical protein
MSRDRHRGGVKCAVGRREQRLHAGMEASEVGGLIAAATLLLCSYYLYRRRRRKQRLRAITAPTVVARQAERQPRSQQGAHLRQQQPCGMQMSSADAPLQRVQWQTNSSSSHSAPRQPSGSRLKNSNVEAALRERAAMREAEDHELAMAMQRSLLDETPAQPADRARALAAAEARARANASRGMQNHPRSPTTKLAPLSPAAGGPPRSSCGASSMSGGGLPLPPLSGGPREQSMTYSAEFLAELDARFNEWSTRQYATSSYLAEIGATARQEQRERIRDSLEREWLAQRRPVFEIGQQRHLGPGRRLGGGESSGAR